MTGRLAPYMPRIQASWLANEPELMARELDGSVVFVDVSGFTKMSERLARFGKVGAEEVTDVIGAVFAALLAIAYGNGGSLLKFGGDALLLWFTDEGHALRACRAAAGMRRELRSVGNVETSGGRIRLRMSCGVHSGRFHLFLVGESHRELMLTGPAASRTVEMEGTAEAGEILVSPATAGLLPASALGDRKGPGVLLRREPRAPTPTADAVAVPGGDVLATGIATMVRRALARGADDPEHRQVTVAFVHYDGTDALIAEQGPQATASALHELVRDVQGAADAHGVAFLATDVDHDGGKIILTAGAPEATGNDDERMLLALHRIVEAERILPVRIGVNRGHVFVGPVGPAYRRTFTVMGDAVNLAARVMAKAAPGQLLATRPVLEGARWRFDTEALEPFMVKGKSQPVEAFAIGDDTGVSTDATATALPLVGREQELASLRERLDRAAAGAGNVVEIVAEPGMGKSRLVQELIASARGVAVHTVACDFQSAGSPYVPLRPLLLALLHLDDPSPGRLVDAVREHAPELEDLAPLIGIPLDVNVPETATTRALEERFRRDRMEDAVVRLVLRSLPGPTLIVIEDAHWMDEASLDLLRRLCASVTHGPLLLVVTRRERDEPVAAGDHVFILPLAPLPPEAAAALLEAVTTDAPLSPHRAQLFVDRAGGNPMFLAELLSAGRDDPGAELPTSVEALMAAQIDRLPPPERVALRSASVLGTSFDASLAADAFGDELSIGAGDPWGRLAEFLDVGDDGVVRFRHALIRDAAYEGLPFRTRRSLHARAGAAIERRCAPGDELPLDLLSFHSANAGDHERAWAYSSRAGRQAREGYANVEAVRFFERAVAAAGRLDPPPDGLVEVWEWMGDALATLAEYRRATDAYRRARMLHHDPREVGRLVLKEARIRERSGSYRLALTWFRRGLDLVGDDPDPELTRLRAELRIGAGSIRHWQGRYAEAIDLYSTAAEEAKQAAAEDVLAHAAYLLDAVYADMGRPDAAPFPGLALGIYERLGDLDGVGHVCMNAGTDAYFRGAWNEALAWWERAREAKRRVGDEIEAALAGNNIGEVLSDQGRLDEAEPLFADASRVSRASGFQEGIAYATGNLGRLAARAGRHEEAAELLQTARQVFADKGSQVQVVETDARIAESLVFRGQGVAALAVVRDVFARASSHTQLVAPLLHRVRGWATAQGGDLSGALSAFEESLQHAREAEATYEEGLTLMAIAQVRELLDQDASAERRAAERFLDALGVIALPEVPLERARDR